MEELPKTTSGSGENITPMEDKDKKPGETPTLANTDGAQPSEPASESPSEPPSDPLVLSSDPVPLSEHVPSEEQVPSSEIVEDLAISPAVISPSDAAAAAAAAQPSPAVELERVPIETALGAGWHQLKSHFLLLIAVSTLACIVMVAPAVVYAVIKELANRNLFLFACLVILLIAVPFLYSIGRIKVSLRLIRGESFNSDDFVNVAPCLFYYMVMFWCRFILTSFAYCSFIVPGIIVQTRLEFAEYFIIDKHQNPFKAMASSWRITKNATMMLVLFGVTRFFIDWLSCLALIVGGVPARWMTLCAQSFIYDRLCQISGISEVPIAPIISSTSSTSSISATPATSVTSSVTSSSLAISDSPTTDPLSAPVVEQPPGADSAL
jgi:hypothetical protein